MEKILNICYSNIGKINTNEIKGAKDGKWSNTSMFRVVYELQSKSME